MIAGVADTHTALWYLAADLRLSAAAKAWIDDAARSGDAIAVSSISLAEVVYLTEKGRVPAAWYDGLVDALRDGEHVLVEAPLTAEVVTAMRTVRRDEVPDLPDRVVAATAVSLDVPVLSRDRKIRSTGLRTVW